MLIYEKLGYNKIISRYMHEIILSDNNRYKDNYYNIDHLIGGNKKNNLKILENSSEEVEEIKFVYDNHKIIFQKINYGDQIHYSLNTLDQKKECLVIILSNNEENEYNKKKTRCADIHQISMYKNCPLVGKMHNGGGSLLLQISIKFIKSIQKENNITKIKIKDNGEKFCVNKKVKLWLLNTLKDGIPWYIKYNFEPYDDENMCLDEINKIKIIANKRILQRTKTSIIEEENLFDITNPEIKKIYDKYKNNSILNFFNKLLNKSTKNCALIENIQDKLINKLLLFDIIGTSYFMSLHEHKIYK